MKPFYNILVINSGSTSTKVAVFHDFEEISNKTLEHSSQVLEQFHSQQEQIPFRTEAVRNYIQELGLLITDFDAFVGRGGSIAAFQAGAYEVNDAMIDAVYHPRDGRTPGASWNACVIAHTLASEAGKKAYIYDAVSTDEMTEIARYSGYKEIVRKAAAHTLNTKAVARKVAADHGKEYRDCNYVITHLGGGISTSAHRKGRIIDMVCDDEGTFSPERAGKVPCSTLIDLCYSGRYTYREMKGIMRGRGGLVSYLGTNSAKEVEARIQSGDTEAKTVYEAMAYQIAKDIGSMAAVMGFALDGIILTGGIAYSGLLTGMITSYVENLAPVTVVPGSFEMEALAGGIVRVLRGEEEVRVFDR
ncbi:MAG: butyrate kinase [Parasporobacterium sp.]|nr:butyrate kinase [Parasporobacterium sp.]